MLELTIEDQKVVLDYLEELKLHEETINEDLKNQPSLFAFYAVLSERAQADLNESKLVLKLLEASLYKEKRTERIDGKKPSEPHIKALIVLDDDYQEAEMDVIMKQKVVGVLKGIKEAFVHRRDSVIALASNMRAQMSPDIYMKKLSLNQAKD